MIDMTSFEDKVRENLEEYMKKPWFIEQTKELAKGAGYLPVEDLTDFRRDIVKILAIHALRRDKFPKVEMEEEEKE